MEKHKLKDFIDFAHFFAACVQNNIQLNRKTCYNYKIQFGGCGRSGAGPPAPPRHAGGQADRPDRQGVCTP